MTINTAILQGPTESNQGEEVSSVPERGEFVGPHQNHPGLEEENVDATHPPDLGEPKTTPLS